MAAEFLAALIHQDEGRIPVHAVLFLETLVLLLHLIGLLFVVGEVYLHQHQLLVGELLKRLLIEGVLLHLNTPSAPVRSGEIKQDGPAILLGRSLGRRKVGLPTGSSQGRKGSGEEYQHEGGNSLHGSHREVWRWILKGFRCVAEARGFEDGCQPSPCGGTTHAG